MGLEDVAVMGLQDEAAMGLGVIGMVTWKQTTNLSKSKPLQILTDDIFYTL